MGPEGPPGPATWGETQVVVTRVDHSGNGVQEARADCPAGTRVLGGGGTIEGVGAGFALLRSYPGHLDWDSTGQMVYVGQSWTVEYSVSGAVGGITWKAVAIAICTVA